MYQVFYTSQKRYIENLQMLFVFSSSLSWENAT